MPAGRTRKRGGQAFLIIGVLLLAIAPAIFASNSILCRSVGILLLIAGAPLVRKYPGRLNRLAPVRWRAWTLGISTTVAAVVSWALLYNDARSGYHQVWPMYPFTGVTLLCAFTWEYIGAKLMGQAALACDTS